MAKLEDRMRQDFDVHAGGHQHELGHPVGRRGHIDAARNRKHSDEDFGPEGFAGVEHIDHPFNRTPKLRGVTSSPADTGSPWPVTRRVRKTSAHEYHGDNPEHWYGDPGHKR
jgi:hypothetical protein